MQKGLVSLVGGLVLLSIGCGSDGDGSSSPVEPTTSAVVSFAGRMNQGLVENNTTSFSIHSIQDLSIYTTYENLDEGGHKQLVKVFSPDGALYYQKIIPFSTNPTNAPVGPLKAMTGIPHDRVTQQALNTVEGYVTVAILPVGGTWITQHGMTGVWRVEVFLDNWATPIATSTFTLTD